MLAAAALASWCVAVASLEKPVQASDIVSHDVCATDEDCQDITSMVQVTMRLNAGPKTAHPKPWLRQPTLFDTPAQASSRAYSLVRKNESNCLPFETSVAANGLPVCVEALMFGLFSALSLPIGAALGICMTPISRGVTARWLALGAGALVFSVATQIYGNSLFALLAVSRKYGPFDAGCVRKDGTSVCDEKMWNMVIQVVAGLIGAGSYVYLNSCLEQWSSSGFNWRSCSPTSSSGSDPRMEDAQSSKPVPESTENSPEDSGCPKSKDRANVALSMWLGMMLDCIPEGLMLGTMTNRHEVSFGFLFAIFIANFPEAFSGASLLVEDGQMSLVCNLMLWSSIFVVTGVVAMAGSFVMPEHCAGGVFSGTTIYSTSFLQGLTGGAMLAMMATAMLPEAYKGAKNAAGLYFVLGFVISIMIQTLDSYLASPQQLLHIHEYEVSGIWHHD